MSVHELRRRPTLPELLIKAREEFIAAGKTGEVDPKADPLWLAEQLPAVGASIQSQLNAVAASPDVEACQNASSTLHSAIVMLAWLSQGIAELKPNGHRK